MKGDPKKKIKEEIFKLINQQGIEKLTEVLDEQRKKYLKKMKNFVSDPEQSWKGFVGNLMEEVLLENLKDELGKKNICVVRGNELNSEKLSEELDKVKRNLVVDFGKFGMHLPDADIVAYRKNNHKVVFIISSKTSLRERLSQTGYWKLKLSQSNITKEIKVFFITLNDAELKNERSKSRAIAEIDTDGVYIINKNEFIYEENSKVKNFSKFLEDIIKLLEKE